MVRLGIFTEEFLVCESARFFFSFFFSPLAGKPSICKVFKTYGGIERHFRAKHGVLNGISGQKRALNGISGGGLNGTFRAKNRVLSGISGQNGVLNGISGQNGVLNGISGQKGVLNGISMAGSFI
jgi:hypothetical protein